MKRLHLRSKGALTWRHQETMHRTRAALALLLLSSLLVSTSAHAFCLKQSQPGAPDGPTCQTALEGSTTLYWPGACVGFHVSSEGIPPELDIDLVQTIAEKVFRDWLNPDACVPSITVVPLEPTASTRAEYGPNGPNQNLIVFRDHGWEEQAETFGRTTVTYNSETGQILDADIELNAQDFAFTPELLELTLQHEAGLFLGLGESSDPTAVMYPNRQENDPARELAEDDENGVCAIYGEPGTRITYGATEERIDARPCALVGTEGCEDLGVDHGCSISPRPTQAPLGAALGALGLALAGLRARRARRR